MTETASNFPVFKTVEVGLYHSRQAFTADLRSSDGIRLKTWVERLIHSKLTLASEREEIDLVVVTPCDLGFKDGAEYYRIIDRARELGLEQPPAEAALQLRLSYLGQPEDEHLLVAHKPIERSGGSLCLFSVYRDSNAQWLSTRTGGPGRRWSPDRRFVFAARKPRNRA